MRPVNLKISAWGPYPGKVAVDFTKFTEGSVFLITGPTGAGKTTIFDGISYALYGNVSGTNREKTSVRSDFAVPESDTYVDFTFRHKGSCYHVVRSPKYERPKKRGEGFTVSNETAVLEMEGQAPITSVIEVNKKIEEIMGINYEQFKQIAMIAQGEFLSLLFAPSKEKVEIFRNLFQTELYDRIQKNLGEKSKKLYIGIREQKNKMDEAIAGIDPIEDEFLMEQQASQNPNYEQIILHLKEHVQADQKSQKEMEKEIQSAEEAQNTQLSVINLAQEMNRNLQALQEIIEQIKELSEQQPKMEQIKEKLNAANEAKKVLTSETLLLDSQNRSRQWELKTKQVQDEFETIQQRIEQMKSELELLPLKETEIIDQNKKLQQIESLLPIIQNLTECRQTLSILKKTGDQIGISESKARQALEQQKVTIEKLTQEYKTYGLVESKLGEVKVLILQAEQTYKELQQGIRLLKEIKEDTVALGSLQERYQKAEAKMKASKEVYEKKEQLYRNAAVGLVARFLVENEPCPVCGSIEHPKKAVISHEIPDEQELDKEKRIFEQDQTVYNQAFNEASTKQALLQTKTKELSHSLTELKMETEQDLVSAFVTKKEESRELIDQREKLKKDLEKKEILEKQLGEMEEKRKQAEVSFEKTQEEKSKNQREQDVLAGSIDQMLLQLPKEYQTKEEVADEIERIKNKILRDQEVVTRTKKANEELHAKKESCQALIQSHKNEWEKSLEKQENDHKIYEDACKKAGFSDESIYQQAKLSEDKFLEYEECLRKYQEAVTNKEAARKHLTDVTKEAKSSDINKLQEQFDEIKKKKQNLIEDKEKLAARIGCNERSLKSLIDKQGKVGELSQKYGYVKDLEDVSKGFNPERMVFEHYVLAAYFEEILQAANLRLAVMTNSRYELMKVSKVSDARTTNSLDIEVLDQYTGKRRSVKTLSGGESFKAALSLALGLSDIIQRNAGGIEIDTLFIDEGFGSLDSESLDQALRTLTTLTGQNKLIGIISHVNDLKERVDNQIIVTKENSGSSIKVVS